MLSKLLTLTCGLLLSSFLLGQSSTTTPPPIKYRLLLTSVELQDLNSEEIVLTLNAFNTGRNPIDLYQFNSVPAEMEIKFEESFYRSNLSEMEGEIVASLINRNITIVNGKILRNLKFNLQSNEDLYKEFTKSQKRFSRSYSLKNKNKSPKLKYKTKTKKSKGTMPDLFAKKENNIKNTTKDIKEDIKEDVNETEIANSRPAKKSGSSTSVEKSDDLTNNRLNTNKDIASKIVTPVDIKVETKEVVKADNYNKNNILNKQKEKKIEIEQAKKESYEIEQASQKEEKKAILESLGVTKKEDNEVAFDTRAGVEESKNSYAAKSVCPDMAFKDVKILKKTRNYITIEYTLENIGKGSAYLGNDSNSTAIAIRAFLSSSENITRGSLPLGGGFVSYKNGKEDELDVKGNFSGTLKLEIKKMTRFTPYVILNFDPFNVLEECSKSNNYGNIKVEN